MPDKKIKEVFKQKQTILKMFFIQYTSRNKINKVPNEIRGLYNKEILSNYWQVYNNNNDIKLKLFFKDDLVKILWKYWSLTNLK